MAELHTEQQNRIVYTMKVSPDGQKERLNLEFQKSCRTEYSGRGMDGYTYCFNGRIYRDVESLWKEPIEQLSGNVQITTDAYGEKVLKTYTQIPTFDSGDREWDSKELEFLFFDGKNIHLVVMRGGYKIARLTFYEKLQAADSRMKPFFEKLGWPMAGVDWL